MGFYFHETDSKFRYWWRLPIANRLLSVQLEIERPFNHYLNTEIEVARFGIDSLKSAVALGATWICRMQEPNGRFNYWYNPETNEFSRKHEDNFLRQAGTNYALLSSFEVLGDSTLLQTSNKNLNYLNKYLINKSSDSSYYQFRRKVKLGGIALPMLVMLKLKLITGDTIFDHQLKALANMVLHLQEKYGTGQFKSTYVYNGNYDYEARTGWESNIYPGEAMLALAEMYRVFGDSKYLGALDHAYQYYSREGRWRHFSFMPWATIAMSKIAMVTNDDQYAAFAYQMTDRMLYWQNIDDDSYLGSLFGVPTVFTSTWMEGVGAALMLARKMGDSQREKTYFNRLMISFQWLLQLQYSKSDLVANGYKEEALGGFRRSLIEPEIRIDNTQHAISSMITAVHYLQ